MKLTPEQRQQLEDKLSDVEQLWYPSQAIELAPLIEGWLKEASAHAWEVGYQQAVRIESGAMERAINPWLEDDA